ncbi:unnamed protein product [marine sediment metagenome]|uniref:Uncharacterized protein n=1 Tax=marine sediment metagenome TaxID=412755 RepID=X0SXG3_9ZZZZ
MANGTIDSLLFVLIDNWPGIARLVAEDEIPLGGFLGCTHHNVAAAKYRKGEKLCVWNTTDAGTEGMATFIYLQVGTQNAGNALAARDFCTTDSATDPLVITNDPDDCIGPKTGGGLVCIALSAMTNAYFGWFWCGGICPESFVLDLGGTYTTEENNVAKGSLLCIHDSTNGDDWCNLGPCGAATEEVIGFAIAPDS